MGNRTPSGGTAHRLPNDIEIVLSKKAARMKAWESLTPLARNEWICWVTNVKKDETRALHVKRLAKEIDEGERRPCCFIGCIHRKDKALSPSVQAILRKKKR